MRGMQKDDNRLLFYREFRFLLLRPWGWSWIGNGIHRRRRSQTARVGLGYDKWQRNRLVHSKRVSFDTEGVHFTEGLETDHVFLCVGSRLLVWGHVCLCGGQDWLGRDFVFLHGCRCKGAMAKDFKIKWLT